MSLFGISRKFAILAVLVFGMSAIATQTAQAQDTYTGLKEFDYRMYLEEVGFPGPGEINPNPNLHIPRARIPQPKEPYPVPRTVPFNAPLPKPALESRIANQMSMKNNDSTLSKGGMACLDFDNRAAWGSQSSGFNLYDDQFAGWGPFVTDDGGYYQAENVFITMERGANRVGDLAIKFHSDMPYSAGIASPTIPTGPGDEVVVIAHYYIHNHGRDPVDWVSMAIKPASENAKCSDGC